MNRRMHAQRSDWSRGGALCRLLAVLMMAGGMGLLGAAETLVVVPPKSVFIDRENFGRDPFFPNSERHRAKQASSSSVTPVLTGDLELKGLSGTAGNLLAIINNTTIQEGETASVKVDNGERIDVECVEIKEHSVRVRVNGKTRELFLRDKWYK